MTSAHVFLSVYRASTHMSSGLQDLTYTSVPQKKALAGTSVQRNLSPCVRNGIVMCLRWEGVLGMGSYHRSMNANNISPMHSMPTTVLFAGGDSRMGSSSLISRAHNSVKEVRNHNKMPIY